MEADNILMSQEAPARKRPRAAQHPKPCFLIARPRSGTTVFNKMLGTHPKLVCLGEIFNESNDRSYFHFLNQLKSRDPKAVFPSNSAKNFLEYLDFCRSHALEKKQNCKIMILDVKYDQAHLLCEPWWRIGQLPRLLFLIREKKWKVIDLHRRDLVRLCISNQVAIQSKIYHSSALKEGQKQTAKVTINPKQLLRDVEATRTVYKSVMEHFSGRPEYKNITYEKMFDDGGRFSRSMLDDVSAFFGMGNLFDHTPKLQKLLSDDIFAYVENASEVRELAVAASADGGAAG
jgi:hypothetical protein